MTAEDLRECKQFCENSRKAIEKMVEIVSAQNYGYATDENFEAGRKFLESHFGKDKDLLCRFIGYAGREMQGMKIGKNIAVRILIEVSMFGITLGRIDGYETAKRLYRPGIQSS